MSAVVDARGVFPGVHGPKPADGPVPLGNRAKRPGERSERRWTPGENVSGPRPVQDVLRPLLWKLCILWLSRQPEQVACYILCAGCRMAARGFPGLQKVEPASVDALRARVRLDAFAGKPACKIIALVGPPRPVVGFVSVP
jgi:hypothetical protein